ncbi:MAG: hypothetical protein QOD63_1921 [Actinomycetota bacterium]|nr:hypothetical protein [Actinomycetota bacterium]
MWPKWKRTTRRDVAPEKAGSSPAGHPTAGDLEISGVSYALPVGSIPTPATILGR